MGPFKNLFYTELNQRLESLKEEMAYLNNDMKKKYDRWTRIASVIGDSLSTTHD